MTVGRTEEVQAAPALSPAQWRLWFLQQLHPDSFSYNVAVAFRVRGPLDVPRLRDAFGGLVARQEVLRWRYVPDAAGTPARVVDPAGPVPVPVTPVTSPEHAAALAHRRVQDPYDLSRDPVLRAGLYRIAADDHLLLIVVHHIAVDHWSLAVLAGELSDRYAGTTPAPLTTNFADYLRARQERAAATTAPHRRYWREQLAGLTPLALPYDRDAAGEPGGRVERALGPELTERLRALARDRHVTTFVVLLAGLVVLLARWCGTDDVAVGAAVADRDRPEYEALVGCLVETVVLRADLSDDPSFGVLLERLRTTVLDAYEHRDLPMDGLVRELAPQRDAARPPLVPVVVSHLRGARGGGLRLPGLDVTAVPLDPGTVRFDLDFFLLDGGRDAAVEVDFRAALLAPAAVGGLLDDLAALLDAVGRDPDRPVSVAVPGLPAASRRTP